MSANRVVIQSEIYPRCSATFEVSSVPGTGGTIILCAETGAMSLQTYATREELRQLGELLLRHANENETLVVAA